MKTYDVCIIGSGGVVGLAIARELAGKKWSVAGIEEHETPGQETSGRNSTVIHSGFHELRGTLKAELALGGSRLIVAYAESKGVRLLKTGMLIAVPRGALRAGLWREASALWNLWGRGRAMGVPFRFIFTAAGVREFAAVSAVGGIFIPPVYVIDVERFMRALEEDACAAGAELFYGHEVVEIRANPSGWVITTPRGELRSRILVNSAGIRANAISRMAGGPQYTLEFLRGDYYEMAGGVARWNIPTLVYPAMPPRAPSKGIHFGPRTDGRLFIGPNARLIPLGSYESDPAPKELFLSAARKFLPEIKEDDLRWAYCGIRPKLAGQNGKADFVIRFDRRDVPLINLIGIDSPGLSASLAIGEYVASMVQETGVLD
jgi:L-2-hydroxyglutarate oxidase LhgO